VSGDAPGGRRASLLALGGALGAVVAVSLLVAAGWPRSTALRLALVLAAWGALALLLAWMFLPGFELPASPSRPRILRRATTFFLVGANVRRWPELARRIVAAGHSVGNHTERHRLLVFRTQAQVDDEIARCQEALAALGITTSLFRPPHGFKPVGLLRSLARHRLRMVAWQGSIRDTDAPGVGVIAARALRLAAPGRILLLHDNPSTQGQSAAALPALIAGYHSLGYRFVVLPQ
jgi:hypothetical protein